MSFVFQRRLNLGSGLGVNVGKTGASLSFRGKYGAIGTNGFSIKTGIPGLSYRHRVGRSSSAGSIFMLVLLAIALIPIALQLLLIILQVAAQIVLFLYWLLIVVPLKLLWWFALTAKDFYAYTRSSA